MKLYLHSLRFMFQGVFLIGVSESQPCLVLTYVSTTYAVIPCQILYNADSSDKQHWTATVGTRKMGFDKLSRLILSIDQLNKFYPNFEKHEILRGLD
jgi:hypothetical protein